MILQATTILLGYIVNNWIFKFAIMIIIKPSILLTDTFIFSENETCPGWGCVCPCECTDCEECRDCE